MKNHRDYFSVLIRRILERTHITIKLMSLLIAVNLLFPFFIRQNQLASYFIFLILFVILLSILCRLVLGWTAFRIMFILWSIGVIIYLIVGITLIYINVPLTPHMRLEQISDRWLYVLAYPIRLLGAFSVGLTFVASVSPIEFLRWGRIGIYIALLFRAIEYAIHNFREIKTAMLLQNEWPEERGGLIGLREAKQKIKKGPTLVSITFRNIIVWSPWAWLCFKQMEPKLKGVLKC